MKQFKFVGVAALAMIVLTGMALTVSAPKLNAQVAVSIGPAPVCPYGYYNYPPYPCAPYGYYGPEWFVNGVFIGVGPWFHGPANFRGHVNNHFDVHHGYHGPTPHPGEQRVAQNRVDKMPHFHGNEVRDGRGHVAKK